MAAVHEGQWYIGLVQEHNEEEEGLMAIMKNNNKYQWELHGEMWITIVMV